jgi:hypothetical protein
MYIPHPLPLFYPIQGLMVLGNLFWGTLSL